MAKVFTPEEREKIKGQVVELVPLSGRETLRALEAKNRCIKVLHKHSRQRTSRQW